MTINELKALFQELEKQDLKPMLCDTEVPLYDASVPCGSPTMCCEDSVELELMPKELLSMHPEFMVSVRGDSMRDVGIVPLLGCSRLCIVLGIDVSHADSQRVAMQVDVHPLRIAGGIDVVLPLALLYDGHVGLDVTTRYRVVIQASHHIAS